jgi:hypothetical protein
MPKDHGRTKNRLLFMPEELTSAGESETEVEAVGSLLFQGQ